MCPAMSLVVVGIMAVLAQHERETTAARTSAAMRAPKARGVRLGTARVDVLRATEMARRSCASLGHEVEAESAERRAAIETAVGRGSYRAATTWLNERGIRTATGEGAWQATQVVRAAKRLGMRTPTCAGPRLRA
jgi:DNA invertase Pin-like site-specific DNA recombinase